MLKQKRILFFLSFFLPPALSHPPHHHLLALSRPPPPSSSSSRIPTPSPENLQKIKSVRHRPQRLFLFGFGEEAQVLGSGFANFANHDDDLADRSVGLPAACECRVFPERLLVHPRDKHGRYVTNSHQSGIHVRLRSSRSFRI